MLETRALTTPFKMESGDIVQTLLALSESGWMPALIESQKYFLQLADIKDPKFLPALRDPDAIRRRSPYDSAGGDIFFKGKDVYYFVVTTGEPVIDAYGRLIREDNQQPTLEIGIISPESNELEKRLETFALAVETAIKSKIDGRKTRHLTFEWSEKKPGIPRLDRLTSEDEKETSKYFSRACLEPIEVKSSNVLTNKLARNTLIEISQAGFVRQQDIVNRKSKQSSEIQATIESLKEVGLLNTEYLLECKQTHAPLTRLKSVEQLQSPEIGDLTCGACGMEFRKETISEGYSLTDLGKRLSRQSHWMTVWITDILIQAGVPESNILWNISETGEEVDLLVEFMGQLWIFELKDREFGSGDAHPLNYRQVRYRASHAIIVTTEQVSKDAKRVLSDLARESRRTIGGEPIYIEGLDAANDILKREVSKAALQYAIRRINILSMVSGYDLRALLTARFGETVVGSIQEVVS